MAKLKRDWDLVDAVQIRPHVSDDGQASTVMFRNLEVGVGGPGIKHGPTLATRVASLRIGVEEGDKPSAVRQIIRGGVEIDAGARAVLLAQLAGNTVLVPMPAADGNHHDLLYETESTLAPGAPYEVTFFLLVESRDGETTPGVLLTVDSFDIEFKNATQKKTGNAK